MSRMFQPSKETVLHRWADELGPQRTVTDMLRHLGDKAIFTPFPPGDEPTWLEALAVLMTYNRFTVDEVMAELSRHLATIRPLPRRRK